MSTDGRAPSPSPLLSPLPPPPLPHASNALSTLAIIVIFILCPCCCCYWCNKNKGPQQQQQAEQRSITELQQQYRSNISDDHHIVISTAIVELAPRPRKTLPSDQSRFIEIGTSLPSECAICLEDIRGDKAKQGAGNRKICMMPQCKHMFHVDCIHNWVTSEEDNNAIHTCPICRASI
ncbi:RING-H2 finger protein ATL3-like [Papaver somniferum]|uniref:RING-H2 finger protein ATL3-like n=1 Tax=Papaver somniferum TaxID=3469 RepID=UPI000E6F6F44|nr:RING-H2 finger protein ATL3-like [Papaver somniferum]